MFELARLDIDYFGNDRNYLRKMWRFHQGRERRMIKVNLDEDC